MMRFLLISLLTLIVCSSCSLRTLEGFRKTPLTKTEIVNPYFSKLTVDYIYKAKVEIYGRYFGGILIIKKVAEDSHRVVFTTEFGSKIFDFLYEGDTFTKNFMLEHLDRKIIVNTLHKDFKLLISEKVRVLEQFASEKYSIYKTEKNKRFNFYFVNASEGKLEKLINTSKHKEKVIIVFESSKASEGKNVAEKITINHSNIKLKIELSYFKKE